MAKKYDYNDINFLNRIEVRSSISEKNKIMGGIIKAENLSYPEIYRYIISCFYGTISEKIYKEKVSHFPPVDYFSLKTLRAYDEYLSDVIGHWNYNKELKEPKNPLITLKNIIYEEAMYTRKNAKENNALPEMGNDNDVKLPANITESILKKCEVLKIARQDIYIKPEQTIFTPHYKNEEKYKEKNEEKKDDDLAFKNAVLFEMEEQYDTLRNKLLAKIKDRATCDIKIYGWEEFLKEIRTSDYNFDEEFIKNNTNGIVNELNKCRKTFIEINQNITELEKSLEKMEADMIKTKAEIKKSTNKAEYGKKATDKTEMDI